jgi:hypothetical protein
MTIRCVKTERGRFLNCKDKCARISMRGWESWLGSIVKKNYFKGMLVVLVLKNQGSRRGAKDSCLSASF